MAESEPTVIPKSELKPAKPKDDDKNKDKDNKEEKKEEGNEEEA